MKALALEQIEQAMGCLEEAKKELLRETPNSNWYAARHLEDSRRCGAEALTIVNRLPQTA